MADDYYTHLARMRLDSLEASRARALADLQQAKADSDYQTASEAVQQLADVEAQKANILALHNQYVASQTPAPPPPEPSQEENHAKPIERMDYGDVWEMSQTSKYGVDENVFRAGMAEVARRRAARGE